MKRIGSKYKETKHLDVAQIAKLVRGEIKAAVKAGTFPKGLKASVRIERYSGGQSINVRIENFGEGVVALNPARVKWEMDNPHAYPGGAPERMTVGAKRILAEIESMLQAYNFDDSDIMTDYFHVRFYGHASVDWEYEAEARKAIEASGEFPDLGIPDHVIEALQAFDAKQAAESESEPEPAPRTPGKIKIRLADIPAIPQYALYCHPTA